MKMEVDKIIKFIQKYYTDNNLGGVVLGISGGKDSAVVAALFTKALGSENVVGLTLPCHSNEDDMKDAKVISDYYGFKLLNIDLTSMFDTFKLEIDKLGKFSDELIDSDINLKPRLRMSACYYMAALLSKINKKTYIVAGTSNKSELFVGYFTKGGDSVSDINVISDFTKDEVIKLGEELHVPKEILYKEPSDGLSNMTDEEKLGVRYSDIDLYMTNKYELDDEIKLKIEKLHNNNKHKFVIPTYKKSLKIGVYVGSFDPVHIGHKNVIDYLINKNIVDKVIVIPTTDYWNKSINASLDDRIKMLKFYEKDCVIIDTELNNLKYTYEILDKLKDKYENDELYLVIGADSIEKFHLWKNINDILKNKVIVLKRNNIDIDYFVSKFSLKDNFIICDDFNKIDVSSSEIRNIIENKDFELLNNYLDERYNKIY